MDSQQDDYRDDQSRPSASVSVYERVYPLRIWLMALGAMVALIGLGTFIGGFAGLVAEMNLRDRRNAGPNIGYTLMVVVAVLIMLGGGISLFCGYGSIRYRRNQDAILSGKKKSKEQKRAEQIAAQRSNQQTSNFINGKSVIFGNRSQDYKAPKDGDVTYTVTYTYQGPPPSKINGCAAYPGPPKQANPTIRMQRTVSMGNRRLTQSISSNPSLHPLPKVMVRAEEFREHPTSQQQQPNHHQSHHHQQANHHQSHHQNTNQAYRRSER